MVAVLVPPGRGRWSPLILRWDERRRDELPLPLDLKPGDLVPVLGSTYRVQSVRQEAAA
jgi:hypothetical protein